MISEFSLKSVAKAIYEVFFIVGTRRSSWYNTSILMVKVLDHLFDLSVVVKNTARYKN